MNRKQILEAPDAEIVALAERLHSAYAMKKTLRYATTRDMSVHSESVAEHVFALLYLAEFFLPLEFEEGEIDVLKLHRLLIFHDFGEIIHGDVVSHLKTAAHEAQEAEDARKVFAGLPEPLGENAQKSWDEYEANESNEAQFAYALDKIEPVFEMLDEVNAKSMKRLKVTKRTHFSKKIPSVARFPVMAKFTHVLGEELDRRGIFWPDH